ncbi:hypothetical protein [Shewanella sp. AC91-MNA-CIBAN-0169]|uniref:hypothetical protein n=1 Tax=Shewanella sp. AC91-MNA-CIBAN-0169 TaxID=3140466 RepID=UPI003317CD6F
MFQPFHFSCKTSTMSVSELYRAYPKLSADRYPFARDQTKDNLWLLPLHALHLLAWSLVALYSV